MGCEGMGAVLERSKEGRVGEGELGLMGTSCGAGKRGVGFVGEGRLRFGDDDEPAPALAMCGTSTQSWLSRSGSVRSGAGLTLDLAPGAEACAERDVELVLGKGGSACLNPTVDVGGASGADLPICIPMPISCPSLPSWTLRGVGEDGPPEGNRATCM